MQFTPWWAAHRRRCACAIFEAVQEAVQTSVSLLVRGSDRRSLIHILRDMRATVGLGPHKDDIPMGSSIDEVKAGGVKAGGALPVGEPCARGCGHPERLD